MQSRYAWRRNNQSPRRHPRGHPFTISSKRPRVCEQAFPHNRVRFKNIQPQANHHHAKKILLWIALSRQPMPKTTTSNNERG